MDSPPALAVTFPTMGETISIIGDGAMGTLCAILLSENDHRVTLWSAFPDAAERLASEFPDAADRRNRLLVKAYFAWGAWQFHRN